MKTVIQGRSQHQVRQQRLMLDQIQLLKHQLDWMENHLRGIAVKVYGWTTMRKRHQINHPHLQVRHHREEQLHREEQRLILDQIQLLKHQLDWTENHLRGIVVKVYGWTTMRKHHQINHPHLQALHCRE
jgi:hypothetical protein